MGRKAASDLWKLFTNGNEEATPLMPSSEWVELYFQMQTTYNILFQWTRKFTPQELIFFRYCVSFVLRQTYRLCIVMSAFILVLFNVIIVHVCLYSCMYLAKYCICRLPIKSCY